MANRKRLTKSLILRICAVGLFICLGTFAVYYSMNTTKKTQLAEQQDQTVDDSENQSESIPEPDGKIATVGFGDPVEPVPTQPSTQSKGFVPPAVLPKSNRSGLSSLKPTGSNGFAIGDAKLPAQTNSSSPAFPPIRNAAPRQDRSSFSNQNQPAPPRQDSKSGFQSLRGATVPAMKIPPLTQNNPRNSTSIPPLRPSSTADAFSPKPKSGNSLMSAPPASPPSSAPRRFSPPKSNTSNPAASITGINNRSGNGPGSLPPLRPTTANSTIQSSPPPARSSSTPGNSSDSITQSPPVRPNQFQSNLAPVRSTMNPSQLNDRRNVQAPQTTQNPPTRFAPTTRSTLPRTNIPAMQNASATTNRSVTSPAPIDYPANNYPGKSLAKPNPGEKVFEGVQLPALAVQKIAPPEIQVNRPATFELIVKNTGRSAANDVVVHDFVPDGTTLLEAVPIPASNSNGLVNWKLGTLAPGQQTSIKMKLLPQRPGNIGSVAHVTFGAQATAQTVCTKPELNIRHKAPSTVLIGSTVLLDIFVENKGNGAAENVVLQEDVPEGLQFANGQREIEYEIGVLRPGETRNVRLQLKATKVGQVRNVLVAHGEGKLQANDSIDINITAPQITLSGEGPNRKFLNRKATHTFQVGNRGTAPATNMQLVARLSRGLRFVEANNQGQYDANNHAVVWRLAKLDPQKTGSVSLTTMPVATGQQDIDVQAIADLNQRQTTRKSLTVQQLAELFFDIDDMADPIETGSGTAYKVRVVNQGQKTATNVGIQVDFPQAIRPTAVEADLRNEIRGQAVVIQPIPSLQPGQEISFVIRAEGLQAGEHRTVVSVRSDDREIAVSKEESTHVYSDR